MDSGEFKEDYRQFIISKWVTQEIKSFKQPSLLDLQNQSKYYKYLIEKFIPNRKDIDILELGSGWGGFIYTLKKLGYSNIDAVDKIPECCAFVENEIGIKVICIDAFDFFPKRDTNRKYDVIAAFDVLEHLNKNEIVQLMQSIYEALSDNGVFIMRTPNGGSLSGLYIRYSGFTHEIAFTPLSVDELFKAIGFKKVYCLPDPKINFNLLKDLVKKLAARFLAKLLSLDPNFINSTNIIGVGVKSDEE